MGLPRGERPPRCLLPRIAQMSPDTPLSLSLLPLSETNLKCIFLRSVAHSSHAQDCLTCFGVGTQQHYCFLPAALAEVGLEIAFKVGPSVY